MERERSNPGCGHCGTPLLKGTFYHPSSLLTFYGYITNSQSDQLPDGLIAQSVEHCTGIAEVMGSWESRSGLNFFQALMSQLLKLCL